MTPGTLAVLAERRAAKVPCVLATRLSDGTQWVLPDRQAPLAVREAAEAALRSGRAGRAELAGEAFFLHPHLPPARLLIVGAVHIAQSLAPLAAAFGIDPVVIDPRTSFATEERFPGISLVTDWPDEAVAALLPDRMTAVVVLSHDPKIDDPALLAALPTEAFYLGALGSGRSHAARLARLEEAGVTPAALARVRGPVGLRLGAVTTEEIALSILAEIVAVRRSGRAAVRG